MAERGDALLAAPPPDYIPFEHARLDVYQLALEFFDLADEIVENLDKRRYYLCAPALPPSLPPCSMFASAEKSLPRTYIAMLATLGKNLQD